MEKITLEYWSLERLRPYANALRQNDDCVERMVEAIRVYGFRIPILARRDGEIVDGELRFKAALLLRLAEVDAVRRGESPEERLAEGAGEARASQEADRGRTRLLRIEAEEPQREGRSRIGHEPIMIGVFPRPD